MHGRRELLLKEVVDQYIRTLRPISSRGLLEEYGHSFSSATVRNELAALEWGGYLYKPYPSAGRVPTRAGYRFFAEWLLELAELQERPQRLPVEPPEITAQQLPDLLRRTALLLASMTGQMGFVLAPPVESLRLAGLVMRWLAPRTVLVVVLSELGVVESRVLELERDLDAEELSKVEGILARRLQGLRLEELAQLGELDVEGWHDPTVSAAVELLQGLSAKELRRRLYTEGLTQLLEGMRRERPEVVLHRVCGLLRVLEDERGFAAALERLRGGRRGLLVHVGDGAVEELSEFSVITTAFFGDSGLLGVIGPLCLDYARAFSALRYVAGRLDAILVFANRVQEVEQ
ncbi:MAG: heat-inducible transcriptional repressor HrcA [Candidatus Bipolaricaulota bacterium]